MRFGLSLLFSIRPSTKAAAVGLWSFKSFAAVASFDSDSQEGEEKNTFVQKFSAFAGDASSFISHLVELVLYLTPSDLFITRLPLGCETGLSEEWLIFVELRLRGSSRFGDITLNDRFFERLCSQKLSLNEPRAICETLGNEFKSSALRSKSCLFCGEDGRVLGDSVIFSRRRTNEVRSSCCTKSRQLFT